MPRHDMRWWFNLLHLAMSNQCAGRQQMAGVLAAGWTGPDCMTRQRRPCTNRVRAEGWDPTEQPANLSAGGWTASRCAGLRSFIRCRVLFRLQEMMRAFKCYLPGCRMARA
jgi:hypothetical protein